MPSVETHDLHHKAIRWPANGVSEFGEYKHESEWEGPLPVHIKTVKTNPYTHESRSVGWEGQLGSAIPLAIGDLLWIVPNGFTIPSPTYFPSSGVIIVVSDVSADDVKGRCTRYEYIVSRWKGVP